MRNRGNFLTTKKRTSLNIRWKRLYVLDEKLVRLNEEQAGDVDQLKQGPHQKRKVLSLDELIEPRRVVVHRANLHQQHEDCDENRRHLQRLYHRVQLIDDILSALIVDIDLEDLLHV